MIWENLSIKENQQPQKELKEALTIKDLGVVSPEEAEAIEIMFI